MSNVLPGVAEVFASFLLFVSILMRLDLPTFDRPINAYSGFVSCGHIDTIGADNVNSAFLISIVSSICVQNYKNNTETLAFCLTFLKPWKRK